MTKEQAIQAILIPPQLEHFCREFNLQIADIEPIFDGWSKHVIVSPELVFLFPRHPQFDHWLERELQVYKVFSNLPDAPIPKLVRIVEDEELSYYRFGVVTRMHGILFSSIELEAGTEKYEHLLRGLGGLTAVWHEVPLDSVPDVIGPRKPDEFGDEQKVNRWMYQALSPDTLDEALEFMSSLVHRLIKDLGGGDWQSLPTDSSISKWGMTLKELADLNPVLIHGDLHEDQIFVRSSDEMEVTGIIDWGNATIDNPVFEFNFTEWGINIWRFRSQFQRFRRIMWEEYLRARKLYLSTLEGLHLFYTLQELYLTTRKKRPIVEDGMSSEDEMRNLLKTLKETTDRI